MVNSEDKYLLPAKEFPKNQADIESLILKRIGEYPEVEVGGILMTNGIDIRELHCVFGDNISITPENMNYTISLEEQDLIENLNFLRNSLDLELTEEEMKGPEEYVLYKGLIYIKYHSHLYGGLYPSGGDIESAREDDEDYLKAFQVIAGKGICEWYELGSLSDYINLY
ncbi:MAG: hypothetical protein KAT28_00050 [Candidatus Aenigmarchaeota archaeon]|nr:hypothetical protein [Candidatus Aenigmarchaeota archaeon]